MLPKQMEVVKEKLAEAVTQYRQTGGIGKTKPSAVKEARKSALKQFLKGGN